MILSADTSPLPFSLKATGVVSLMMLISSYSYTLQSAWGHHPTSGYGLNAAAPQTFLELDTQLARYPMEIDGFGGGWQSFTLRGEWMASSNLSMAGNLPLVRVAPEEGASRLGLGDVEFSAKWGILRPKHGVGHLSIGLGIETPTGSSDDRLGSGHFELSPFLSFNAEIAPKWVLFGRLAAQITLSFHDDGHDDAGDTHHDHGDQGLMGSTAQGTQAHTHDVSSKSSTHGSIIAPHADRELNAQLGIAYSLEETGYVSIAWEDKQPISSLSALGERGVHLLKMELGLYVDERIRFAIGVDQALFGTLRFWQRARLGFAYWF